MQTLPVYLYCLAGCNGCLLLGGGLATQPWGAAAAGLTPKLALFCKNNFKIYVYYYYYIITSWRPRPR